MLILVTCVFIAAFETGWAKVAAGETPDHQEQSDEADFAHSKNYSNADAHIASYGSYPTLYSDDKETQLEAVVEDRAADSAAAAEADSPPGQSSDPGSAHSGDDGGQDVAAQAGALVEEAQDLGQEAVHKLAAAGNAAAELVEESLGLEATGDASPEKDTAEEQSPTADRQRVLLEEGEKIAASIVD